MRHEATCLPFTTNRERMSITLREMDKLLTSGGVDKLLDESKGTSFLELASQIVGMVPGKEAEAIGAQLQNVYFIRHDRWAGRDGFRNKILAKAVELTYTAVREEFLRRASEAVDATY